MIAALDVHYADSEASAAAVVFESWDSERAVETYVVSTQGCGDYSPGEFYLRELLPLLAVISAIREDVSAYVIDGYCHLSAGGDPGLGVHLAQSLVGAPKIVGVAKNRFRNSHHAFEVLRGGSERPLFVTSIGLDYEEAADKITSMHGSYRFPTLLKEVDRLSRTTNSEQGAADQLPARGELKSK